MQHFSQIARRVCTLVLFIIIINPRRACAARVTVVCVHSYLPPQRILRNTGIVLNFADFPKNASFKSYGVIIMPTSSSSGVLALFPHEISFYAGLKPIATFSLHRQRSCGRQRAILWHRLVKRHRYTDHEY